MTSAAADTRSSSLVSRTPSDARASKIFAEGKIAARCRSAVVFPEPGPPRITINPGRPAWIKGPISSSSGIASPVSGEMMRGRTRACSAGKLSIWAGCPASS